MKKVILSILSLILVASFLTACSNSDGATIPSNQSTSSTAASQKPEKEEPKPVIKYVGSSISWDPNKEHTNALLNELTGYEVEYYILPSENANEKLSIDLASGTDYDVLRLGGGTFGKLSTQKALKPMEDLINEFGPNIQKNTKKELYSTTTLDGVVYGIPDPAPNSGVYWDLAVRQDVLDELNLEMPETIDDFYNVLKTIKEKTDLIPLTSVLSPSHLIIENIASAFGVSTYYKDIDGQLKAFPEQTGMKEYLAFMNKLYKEGLLDNDLPVNKNENVREKFTSGQVAMAPMTWGGETPMEAIMPALKQNQSKAVLQYMKPLKGTNGQQEYPLAFGLNMIASIPITSKHPEDAIKYLDAILDEKNYDKLCIGEENVHWKKEGNDFAPILPAFFEDYGNSWWMLPVNDYKKFTIYWSQIRIKKNMDVYDAYAQINDTCLQYGKLDPTATIPVVNDKAEYEQKLRGLESDYYNRVISGAEDLAKYDDFVKSWNAEGGTAMIESVNKWYATQK